MSKKGKQLTPRSRSKNAEIADIKAKLSAMEQEKAAPSVVVPVPEPTAAPEDVDRAYAVLLDAQGVAYLRTAQTEKHSLFVLNTGTAVELIKMDAGTVSTRGLQVVDTDILAAARILFTPLTESVIVSERAKTELNKILNDEEWITFMAAEKKHRSAKKGTKGTARAKSPKTAGVRAESAARKITLVAKENPKRKDSSSFKRFALYKSGMTVGDFIAKGGTMADVNYDSAKGYVKVSG